MRKYIVIQVKRLLRILPPILVVAAILFGCLGVVYNVIVSMDDESGEKTKFSVALVGAAGDTYLSMGLAAVESFDSTRYTVEFIEMEESEAETAMRRGEIVAFIVIPDGFMDAAIYGDIMPLKYVCSVSSLGLVSMVKDELTQVIETILVESQKGIYGAGNALNANDMNGSQIVGAISLEYAEFIFARSKMYRATEMTKFDGLGMGGYMLSGLGVVLFLLICLTFAPVMIRSDQSLARMLSARRRPVVLQAFCDFAVYLIGLMGIAIVILLCIVLSGNGSVSWRQVCQCIPAFFALGAMSFLMYEAASDLVSGVLLQFFITLVLCFISGCLYPVTFFPETVQKLSAFLPTGLARMQIAGCITGDDSWQISTCLIGFGIVFLGTTLLIRRIKVSGVRG